MAALLKDLRAVCDYDIVDDQMIRDGARNDAN